MMDHQNDKDDLKKQLKKMEEKNVNQREHLLGKCRVLWDELRRRGAEEDDENLVDASGHCVSIVEEE